MIKMQHQDFNSVKHYDNSEMKNNQSLQQLLRKQVDAQAAQIDWSNKDISYSKKQDIFLSIVKTVTKQFKSIGGCSPNFMDIFQKYINKASQVDNYPEQSYHKKLNGITSEDIDALLSSSNVFPSDSRLNKYDPYLNVSINQNRNSLKSSYATSNKNLLNEESSHCQKVVTGHPYKQKLINDQQRQQKAKKSTDDDVSKEDSDSDYNGFDEFQGSSKKRKMIQKKKYQFPTNRFESRELPNEPRPRGRPPNIIEQPSGAKSLFEATAEDKQKVLEYFQRHYDPQRRNKIQIVNQLAQEGRFSQSSIYQFLTNPDNPKTPVQTQSFYKPSRTTSSYQSQLQQQQQQQIQYYKQNRHIFNSCLKTKEELGKAFKITQNTVYQQPQNRNQQYQDQVKREQRLTPSDNYSSSQILSQSYISYNQHSSKNHPSFYQSQTHHYQGHETLQGDTDQGNIQNQSQQNIMQNILQATEPQKNINHLGLIDSHSTSQFDFHRNTSKELIQAEI